MNDPHFRVVVADQQRSAKGGFIEEVGSYHPALKKNRWNLNLERVDYWMAKGALPTETVRTLIKRVRKEAKPVAA